MFEFCPRVDRVVSVMVKYAVLGSAADDILVLRESCKKGLKGLTY